MKGNKKILSIDGGGVRGCLSIGYLEKIESVIREQTNQQDAVLADYFDLIGGTSTGALIAAQLALGFDIKTIRKNYSALAPKVFSKKAHRAKYIPWLGKKLFTKWSVQPLERLVKHIVTEERTLDSEDFKSDLCIITKRADTFSTWPLLSNKKARFNKENGKIPLWKALRASSAAPTFFKPIKLDVSSEKKQDTGMFIDGGVSMANNPALQLFLVATLKGFPYQWETGEDNLLVVSVGTGFWKRRLSGTSLKDPWNLFWAEQIPEMLMQDASLQNELLMQLMSNSKTNLYKNFEIGDLSSDLLHREPAFTYLRYNVELEMHLDYQKHNKESRNTTLVNALARYNKTEIERLRQMDYGANAAELLRLSDIFASEEVKSKHFPNHFAKSA